MGNKREARRRIADAGVPVLPGAELASDTADEVESAAQSVGYPLMVKASRGRRRHRYADSIRPQAACPEPYHEPVPQPAEPSAARTYISKDSSPTPATSKYR